MIRFWAVAPHDRRRNKHAGDVWASNMTRYVDLALKRLKDRCGLEAVHLASDLSYAEIAAERQSKSGVRA